MRNSTHNRSPKPHELQSGTRLWQNLRQAYLEILLDLPPNYDQYFPYVPKGSQDIAQRNYEVTREACLHLAMQGKLPSWPSTAPVPQEIHDMVDTLAQERRLGRELGLTLSLAATPLVQEDLGQLY